MTRQSRERLLGFLVLLAMAAIFLPMVLDGEGVRQGRLLAVLPEPPEPVGIVHYQPQFQPHADTAELADPQPTDGAPLRSPPQSLVQAGPAKAGPSANTGQIETKPAANKAKTTVAKKTAPKTRMGTVKPGLDQQGVPTGWTLQLASFKKRANAAALQQRLSKLGYKAYIRDKGDLSKVFVGPDLQKDVIEGLKAELKRKLKLDGLVLRFRP